MLLFVFWCEQPNQTLSWVLDSLRYLPQWAMEGVASHLGLTTVPSVLKSQADGCHRSLSPGLHRHYISANSTVATRQC